MSLRTCLNQSDQDKVLFEERLNALIEANNAVEDAYIASLQLTFTLQVDTT